MPFLNDGIVIAGGEPTLQKKSRAVAGPERIMELEASIAALKTQQLKELQAARGRLRELKIQTGPARMRLALNKSSMGNLKSILQFEFRIVGVLGPQGQKENHISRV